MHTDTHTANQATATAFTISRDRFGKLKAQTVVVLGFDRRELHITTDKGYNGGIECEAVVYQITADGMGRQHCFDIGNRGGGDYRRTLKADPKGRATAAALTRMHAEALADLQAIVGAASAHYKQPGAAA